MVTVREDGDGDYLTLKAAIDADETVIDIDLAWDDPDTAGLIVVDSGFPPVITCSGDAKNIGRPHDGSETTYRLRQSGAGHLFELDDDITIVGMDFQNGSTTTSDECFRQADTSNVTLTDCVGGFASRNDQQDLLYNDAEDGDHVITNCAFYNVQRSVFGFFFNGTVSIDLIDVHCFDVGDSASSTSRSGVVGVRTNTGNLVVTVRSFYGLYEINTGTPFTSAVAESHVLNVDRCITSAADFTNTAWGTETIDDSLDTRTWTANASPGAGDFVIVEDIGSLPDLRLQDNATDNDAQDLSTDSTGANGLTAPSTDIVGTSRPQNTNFDAGMFEVVAAAAVGDIAPIVTVAKRRVQTGRLLSM